MHVEAGPEAGLLDVYAANNYGFVRLQATPSKEFVLFKINSTGE
jgi:hypothetical protein